MASVAVMAMLVFTNCRGAGFSPPEQVERTFERMYPQAKWVAWEISNSYYVAEFHLDGAEMEAWFDPRGEWSMTESDLEFGQLPVVIRNDFDAGEFGDWDVDDIDRLERAGMETLYVIEVERGDQEMDLHYLANGTRVKTVIHDGPNMPPTDLPAEVKEFLGQKYPQATVIEAEEEHGLLVVSVVDAHTKKEVVFNHQNRWVETHWEVYPNDLPAEVRAALAESAYARYQIEDIDYEEQADGTAVYILELELGHQEVEARVNAATAEILSVIQE